MVLLRQAVYQCHTTVISIGTVRQFVADFVLTQQWLHLHLVHVPFSRYH